MVKKIFIVLMILFLGVNALGENYLNNHSVFATNIVEEGKCGKNAYWSINSEGLLRIYGTGDMYNYGCPNTIKTTTIGGKPDWRFNSSIKSIVIEEGITSLGQGAFVCLGADGSNYFNRSPVNMGDLVIPSTVKSIGSEAFWGCVFNNVTIPETVESYETVDESFSGTLYSDDLFRLSKIENIYIQSKKMPELSSLNIKNVYIGDKITKIPSVCFQNSNIENVYMGNSIEEIGSKAFNNVGKLKTVKLPENCILGDGVFYDCKNLEEIIIPKGCKRIQGSKLAFGIFWGCSELKKAEILCDWDNTEGMFANCSSLKEVNMTEIKEIGSNMFYNCSSLEKICLPSSVDTISNGAFSGCVSLKSIYIPESVIYLSPHKVGDFKTGYYRYVFENCQNSLIIYTGVSEPKENWYTNEWNYTGENYLDVIYNCSEEEYKDFNNYLKNCTITLSSDNFTYTGEECVPIVSVKKGNITLVEDKDYEAEYSDNINAGQANVIISGKGKYTGVVNKTFTINKANSILKFKDSSIIKKLNDNPFTNELTKKTDGKLVFSSSNISVATVNSSSGLVTLKGTGNTVISVRVDEGENYKAANLSYKLYVEAGNIYNLGEETYGFKNYRDSDSPGGHCFGMAMTSAGYYLNLLKLSNIGINSSNLLNSLSSTTLVNKPICHYQKIQGTYSSRSIVAGGKYYLESNYDIASDWQQVVNYVKNHQYDNTGKLTIGIRSGEGGHALNFLYYDQKNGQDRIYAYDNNFPEVETYFYMNSAGQVLQAPKSTFFGSIYTIALRDVSKYYSLAGIYDLSDYIYAEPGNIYIPNIMGEKMDGTSTLMYTIPDNLNNIAIIPLKNNAEFLYMDDEYSFGKITKDTYADFNVSASEENYVLSENNINIHNTGRITVDPCYYGHSFKDYTVILEPTCCETGIKISKCRACETEIKEVIIPSLGHEWSNWQTIQNATIIADGYKKHTCSICGISENVTVSKAATIKLSTTSYTYDGKEKKPSVSVLDSNGKTISSSNYTVSYASGRKNVGSYKVTVKGKGNYSFTKTLTFKINPPKTSVSSLTKASKAFTAKWSKKSTQVTGYEIQYSTSSKFASGNKTVTVSSYKTTSKKISGLKSKKKYYVRIRTYKTVSGTKYYSSWSTAKNVTTK